MDRRQEERWGRVPLGICGTPSLHLRCLKGPASSWVGFPRKAKPLPWNSCAFRRIQVPKVAKNVGNGSRGGVGDPFPTLLGLANHGPQTSRNVGQGSPGDLGDSFPTFKMHARPCKILGGFPPGKLGYAHSPGIPVRFAGFKFRKQQKM